MSRQRPRSGTPAQLEVLRRSYVELLSNLGRDVVETTAHRESKYGTDHEYLHLKTRNGPIESIKIHSWSGSDSEGMWRGEDLHFEVYDSRLDQLRPKISIRTVRRKNIPAIGVVENFRWTGRDQGTGLIDRLHRNTELNTLLLKEMKRLTCGDIHIRASMLDARWRIEPSLFGLVAKPEVWLACEAIANYLLEPWESLKGLRLRRCHTGGEQAQAG